MRKETSENRETKSTVPNRKTQIVALCEYFFKQSRKVMVSGFLEFYTRALLFKKNHKNCSNSHEETFIFGHSNLLLDFLIVWNG